jgi:hypothetical protein
VVAPIGLKPDYDDGETLCAALASFVSGSTSALIPPINELHARVLNNVATANAFKAVLDQCAIATRSASEINGIVDVAMCTSTASAPARPFVLTGDTVDGPDMAVNGCQP